MLQSGAGGLQSYLAPLTRRILSTALPQGKQRRKYGKPPNVHSPLYMQCILYMGSGHPNRALAHTPGRLLGNLDRSRRPHNTAATQREQQAGCTRRVCTLPTTVQGTNGRGKSPATRMQGLTHALRPDGCAKRNGDHVRGGNEAESTQQDIEAIEGINHAHHTEAALRK
jgi:hypothetical protein